MIVMKFGGTSVGNPEMLERVANIVKRNLDKNPILVFSAMSGVTDMLISGTNQAETGDRQGYLETHKKLKEKHLSTITDLLGEAEDLRAEISKFMDSLLNIWMAIEVLGEVTPRAMDAITSFGEKMNVRIFASYLNKQGIKAQYFDADSFIVTSRIFGNACPIEKHTRKEFEKTVMPSIREGFIPVITGFIGKTPEGVTTTLGRGGSDLTATFLGGLLGAEEVWIWTDVNGVMTADPRIVKNARPLKELSFIEVTELSYYGAKVMHPRSLLPVMEKDIPVRILNTFNPDFPGTLITKTPVENRDVVKSITYIKDLVLLNVTGRGMLGVPGIAARVFKTAWEKGANVLMISQSSSEQNICFVVRKQEAQNLVDSLKEEFELEILHRDIEGVERIDDVAIISVVGAGMRGTPGIAGKIFTITGKYGINVIAISQGSSEYNISFVVSGNLVEKAVQVLHKELIEGQ